MLYFAIPSCEVHACLHWRTGNKCVKDKTLILVKTAIPMTMQSVEICEVHKQSNAAKLHNLLEE